MQVGEYAFLPSTIHITIVGSKIEFIAVANNWNKKAVLSPGEPRDAAVNFDTIEFYNKSIMKRLCTLNTATLSTQTHRAPKPAQNTLNDESRLEVIQGHAFWDHWKADLRLRITVQCIIMWALESEISKERSEHLRFRELHCHSAPPSMEPLWIFAQSLHF